MNVKRTLAKLVNGGMPARELRETAAQLACTQSPGTIVATLEEHEGEGGLAEFLYVLTHEAVLRGKVGEMTPVAIRLADRMRREGHPLARLPLRLSDLEADVPAFLPRYRPYGVSEVLLGTPGGWGEDRADGVACPGSFPAFREVTTAETVDRVAAPVRTGVEKSNGRFEIRQFEFEEPVPARWISSSLLRLLGLECLAGAGEGTVHLWELTASQGFSYLFSAAATGGAYTRGEGGAYGRLSAWEAVGALTGCSEADIARASAHAWGCAWFSFWNKDGWFYDVAWDLGLAVLSCDGRFLVIFAATDTD